MIIPESLKKIVPLILGFITAITGFGSPKGDNFYLYAGYGPGLNYRYNCFNVGFNFSAHTHNLFAIQFNSLSWDTPNVPSDYHSGSLFSLSPGGDKLRNYGDIISLQYGRIFTSPGTSVRVALKGGLGVCNTSYIENFRPHVSTSWFYMGSNYDYDTRNTQNLTLVIDPEIEFPVNRAFGLSLGVYYFQNTDYANLGCCINILLGAVKPWGREKRKRFEPRSNNVQQ